MELLHGAINTIRSFAVIHFNDDGDARDDHLLGGRLQRQVLFPDDWSQPPLLQEQLLDETVLHDHQLELPIFGTLQHALGCAQSSVEGVLVIFLIGSL